MIAYESIGNRSTKRQSREGRRRVRRMRPATAFILLTALALLLSPAAYGAVWTYYDESGERIESPTEEDIKTLAVKRVNETVDPQQVQYLLEIKHDFSATWGTGYLENIGNPNPGVGRHWIDENRMVDCKIDGIVPDTTNLTSRYIATGYSLKKPTDPTTVYEGLNFDGVDDWIDFEKSSKFERGILLVFSAKRNVDRDDTSEDVVFSLIVDVGQNQFKDFVTIGFEGRDLKIDLPDDVVDGKRRMNIIKTPAIMDNEWHEWRVKIEWTEWIEWQTPWLPISRTDISYMIYRDGNLISRITRDGSLETSSRFRTALEHKLFHDESFNWIFGDKWDYSQDYSYKGMLKGLGILQLPDGQNWTPVAAYPLNETGGTTATDSSGNNIHGTLKGFAPDCWGETDISYVTEDKNFNSIADSHAIALKMDGPMALTYKWGKQYSVSVSANPVDHNDLPGVEVLDSSGTVQADGTVKGAGIYWYDRGTRLRLNAGEAPYYLQPDGFKLITGMIQTEGKGQSHEIASLTEGLSIVWEYAFEVFKETVVIGSPVQFSSVPADYRKDIAPAKPLSTTVTVPADGNPDDMYIWSPYDKRLYPVRPGAFTCKWGTNDPDIFIYTEVEAIFGSHYQHVANTPPVALDPLPTDPFFFSKLAYAENDAAVDQSKGFTATQKGRSVLVFTQTEVDVPSSDPKQAALYLDGQSNYVRAPTGVWFSGDMTVEGWVYLKSYDSFTRLIDFGNGPGTDNVIVGITGGNNNKKPQFALNIGTTLGGTFDSSKEIPLKQWVHIAATIENGTGRLYMDGEEVASAPMLMPEGAVTTRNFIGYSNWDGQGRAHAAFDDIRIWRIARSQTEIQNNMDTALTGNEEGLLAYYRFDDFGSQVLKDSTPNRRDATMVNMDPAFNNLCTDTYQTDPPVKSVAADLSAGGYLKAPADVWFSGDLTVEGWVYVRSHRQYARFIDFSGGSGNNSVVLALSAGETGKPLFTVNVEKVSGGVIQSDRQLPLNRWVHLAATMEGEMARLYLDGEQVASGRVAVPSGVERSENYIGKSAWSNDGIADGLFDEIRIWNVARTQGEIRSAMNTRLAGDETGLYAYYRLDDGGSATHAADSAGGGRHAELVGMDAVSWRSSACAVAVGDIPPAKGDTSRESLLVRVVETDTWKDRLNPTPIDVAIGEPLVSADHGVTVPHNGYVFWERARYNPEIYNRSTLEGSIIPVNRQFTDRDEDRFVVVWYQTLQNVAWPWKPVEYNPVWPGSRRIVIASRQGSDGKDAVGNDQLYLSADQSFLNYLDPVNYTELTIYHQPDPAKAGYNPNEEHALVAPSFRHSQASPRPMAVFALRNDLNITSPNDAYTSHPYVLAQYRNRAGERRMLVLRVDQEDSGVGYTFRYPAKAGQPIVAPYPLNEVIGAAPPAEISGRNGDPNQRCYWEDHKGQPWAVSGGGHLFSHFWYPLRPEFWYNRDDDGDGAVEGPGEPVSWLPSGTITQSDAGFPDDMVGRPRAMAVRYDTVWPEETAVLKAGETLTFSGGEYRKDHSGSSGLPGVIGWSAAQVVFDDRNRAMAPEEMATDYLARIDQVLEERSVDLSIDHMPEALQPAAGAVDVKMGKWFFKDLHAGIKTRVFYDPLTEKLSIRGFLNGKTIGDDTLTAAPPAIYVLQPNIMTEADKDAVAALSNDDDFKNAVEELYSLSRDPQKVSEEDGFFGVGLENTGMGVQPAAVLGPGAALMPNADVLDPGSGFTEGYVTLAENNHPDLGAAPVTLHIVKVVNDKYRGAIKTVFSDNVFDEKIALRHTADFGANPENLIFQWWYREEDGATPDLPNLDPTKWRMFPTDNDGLEASEITLAGAGKDLLVDNMFFVRYRHKDCSDAGCWSDWAGAANSRPPGPGEAPSDTFRAQLAEGWVKRVINAVNPYEARIRDFFSSDSPATYVSMIQQAGPRYEGPVALNPDKNVIENVGLISLYQTVLDRGRNLSIDMAQPASSSGVTAALLLAASRINDFYGLLGDEAYSDAMDPTIGFGTDSGEYGSLAPTIFSFMNQVPDLLSEELCLLRGAPEEGASPSYNRLMWNFTKSQGEVAYAMNYNIGDVDKNGFIDAEDGRALYPQGHGDAWGHYLTAMRNYYELLGHPEFNWESRSEKFSIGGVVIDVDYLDERKFAETAAKKAKTGHRIADLTYRSKYVADPDGQWQGYRDTDASRAWGVEGWSRRTAMGAYFDWVTANAVLPAESDPVKSVAYDTNGDGYLAAPADVWFSGDLTITAWVLARSNSEWDRVIDFGNGPLQDNVVLSLSKADSGKPSFSLLTGDDGAQNGGSITADRQLPLRQWVHLAVTLEGTTGRLYMDGEKVAEADNMSVPRAVERSRNYIGASNYDARQADALFDDISIWRKALSAEEIKAGMEKGFLGYESELLAYYRLNDGPGADKAADSSLHGRHADLVNGSWYVCTDCAEQEPEGIKRIDRETVVELREIAGQARAIQELYNDANAGLNPVGVAAEAVPFDIDPARIDPGQGITATHFEQVYERALKALDNARLVFDHASDLSNRIRQVADSAEAFTEQTDQQDRDYRNRLIEIFGTPYDGTIGAGKLYPAGYQGPDYFYYNYVDVSEVSDKTVPSESGKMTGFFDPITKKYEDMNEEFKHFFENDLNADNFTDTDFSGVLEVEFPMSAGKYSFQAPAEWGMRRSPGEVQQALIDLIKAEADLQLALSDYASLIGSIESAADRLEATFGLNKEQLDIENGFIAQTRGFNAAILTMRSLADLYDRGGDLMWNLSDAASEWIPKVLGVASDGLSPARGAIKTAAAIFQATTSGIAWGLNSAADGVEAEKEIAAIYKDIQILKADQRYEVQQQLLEIETLMGNEAAARLSVFKAREHMRQVSESYRSILAKGLRLMEERQAFNKKVAAKTQGNRYQDMAFRVNRNDALSRYHSAFDTAAKFLYLAARAYDYETNLSHDDPASAVGLLTDIVRQRTLGQFLDGKPVAGRGGLADIAARLDVNFSVLKTQMGLNNPQSEAGRFSLRSELFRIERGDSAEEQAKQDAIWRNVLEDAREDNLWTLPEFRKYCRPFAAQGAEPEPGLVIDFTSNVVAGKNFFGFPLSGGDHAYDASNYATKVRSVGLWFENYDSASLSLTPRAYLVPVGMDVMLVPDSTELDTREWTVLDQKIPVPLPLGRSNLTDADWIPAVNGLDGSMIEVRRYSSFRAYHDSGYWDESQMTFDSRLVGRSVWNTRWLLIIPGQSFLADPDEGLDAFIHGKPVPGDETGGRDGNGVKDIKLYFQTYAISGN